MRNYLFYRTLLLCCLLISTIAHSQLQKIYLHPKVAGNGKQSQFVDSIRFIPLEIKEGIQVGTYNNIQITEKYFLITDHLGKTIFVYARNGSFINKISYKKLGNGFYPSYNEHTNQIVFFGYNKNYALSTKDGVKIMLDWNNPRNKKYFKKYTIDLKDTSFAFKKAIPNQNDIIRAYQFDDDHYWQGQIFTSSVYKDSLDYEFKIYRNNQLVKGFFPYNHIDETRFLYANESVSVTATDNPNIHYITRPYCDTIYKMVKDSLFPLYHVVLPLENSLPLSFFTKPFKNRTERENFKQNNGWMLRQFYSFYETPSFIHFNVGYLNNYDSYIYIKQTNVTYKTKNIRPDSSQYNLQLLADFNILRKGDRLYKSQKAGDLIAFFEQNKNVAVPKELEDFLKSNPPATTPIIVEFKLKN
ncbi:6-bladed beta-propeller [Chitinophagaceae bacterium LB-8]|uniref:6-bladed beta-propeller n=1 Tax=Paraflavisolibacter caeni TaxID=2982496 RepID=A0A9X3BGM4_9BACT|nr:6-bladed beta-propeller [Paraflavisolibacter caeni]MCU7551184.1 6-bladed beta-propeller [Paraflavisolibacter caeni]